MLPFWFYITWTLDLDPNIVMMQKVEGIPFLLWFQLTPETTNSMWHVFTTLLSFPTLTKENNM